MTSQGTVQIADDEVWGDLLGGADAYTRSVPIEAIEDGWLELPCGGAVEVRDGVPVRVTDNGNYRLDDRQILQEAAAATGTQLKWREQGRSRRWRSRLGFIFDAKGTYRKEVAGVLRDACTVCGLEVGESNVTPENGGPVEWAGQQCAHAMIAHHLEPDAAAEFRCDGSCGPGR